MTQSLKRSHLVLLIVTASVTANHADDDPRVPELEARLKSVEAKLDRLLGILDELSGRSAKNRAEPRFDGRPLSEHVLDLGDRSGVRRGLAQCALAECGTEAIPALVAALGAEDSLLRVRAVETLGAQLNEPRARAAVLAALAGKDKAMGVQAARSLERSFSDSSSGFFEIHRLRARSVIREVHEALLAALTSPDPDIRLESAHALLWTAEDEELRRKVPLELFLDQLQRTDRPLGEISDRIAEGFGGLGPRAQKAVPVLIALLKKPGARIAAANALGLLGKLAEEALPGLRELATALPLEPDTAGFQSEDVDTVDRAIRQIEQEKSQKEPHAEDEDK